MKKSLLAFILIILFVACGNSEKFYFTLDNPSDEKITLSIDGKEYNLDVRSYEKINLAAGEHTIENNEYKVNFTVYYDSKGGIINPTGSPYIIESNVYSVENTSQTARVRDSIFEVDGYQFYGPAYVISDFIIDRSNGHSASSKGAWDYDIFEPFPEKIKIDRDVNIFSKIYNKNEFLEMLETADPDLRADYEQNKKIVKNKPTFGEKENNYDKNMSIVQNLKNENIKNYAIEVVELDEQYAQAKDVKSQKKIKEDYKKAWKEYINATVKLSDEEKVSMPGYVSPVNFGKGIIINSVETK